VLLNDLREHAINGIKIDGSILSTKHHVSPCLLASAVSMGIFTRTPKGYWVCNRVDAFNSADAAEVVMVANKRNYANAEKRKKAKTNGEKHTQAIGANTISGDIASLPASLLKSGGCVGAQLNFEPAEGLAAKLTRLTGELKELADDDRLLVLAEAVTAKELKGALVMQGWDVMATKLTVL